MLGRRIRTHKSLTDEPLMLASTKLEAIYNAQELLFKTIKTWKIIASLISHRWLMRKKRNKLSSLWLLQQMTLDQKVAEAGLKTHRASEPNPSHRPLKVKSTMLKLSHYQARSLKKVFVLRRFQESLRPVDLSLRIPKSTRHNQS